MLIALLIACSAKPPVGDDTAPEDTEVDYGDSPTAPEDYKYLWDVDASGCVEEDADAAVYKLFSGSVDNAGNMVGQEGWYWFFATEGWEGDCVDTFDVDTVESDIDWQEDPCSGCDREFSGTWNLADSNRTCGGFDYEDFFENDDVDDDRYNAIVMLDPLSPAGNVNETTLVMVAFQDDDNTNSYTFVSDYARGDYIPTTEGDYEGPATVTWVTSSATCVEITSG